MRRALSSILQSHITNFVRKLNKKKKKNHLFLRRAVSPINLTLTSPKVQPAHFNFNHPKRGDSSIMNDKLQCALILRPSIATVASHEAWFNHSIPITFARNSFHNAGNFHFCAHTNLLQKFIMHYLVTLIYSLEGRHCSC